MTLLLHLVSRVVSAGPNWASSAAAARGWSPSWAANALCAAFGSIAAGLITDTVVFSLLWPESTAREEGPFEKVPSSSASSSPASSSSSSSSSPPPPTRPRLPAIAALIAGVVAGLAFAFSPLTWRYHVGVEVFALNNFFVALLVWETGALLRAVGSPSVSPREVEARLMGGALTSGLALCNQHTSILFIAPLVLSCVWMARPWMGVGTWARAALAFVVGLAPYAQLPLAQGTHRQPGSWGDSTSLAGFWRHFTRADYGTFRLYSGSDSGSPGLAERTKLWLLDALTEQFPVGWGVLAVLGVAALAGTWIQSRLASARGGMPPRKAGSSPVAARDSRPSAPVLCESEERLRAIWCVVLMGSLATYLVVFHSLSNMPLAEPLLFGVHQRFWMQPNLVVAVLGGVGLGESIWFMAQRVSFGSGVKAASSAAAAPGVAIAGLLAYGCAFAASVWSRAPALSQAQNRYVQCRDTGRVLRHRSPPNVLSEPFTIVLPLVCHAECWIHTREASSRLCRHTRFWLRRTICSGQPCAT